MAEKISFNLSRFCKQNFSLPKKLVEYINQNANAKIKQKLDRTCKYFYKEAPYFIIDTFIVYGPIIRVENEMFDQCIDTSIDNGFPWDKIDNIWITKKLKYCEPNLLIDKVVRCDASHVSIGDFIDLPFEKFLTLTKSGKVEVLEYFSVVRPDGSATPLEDILTAVPNAYIIKIDYCHFTPQSFSKLLSISWKQKLKKLYLGECNYEIDVNFFYEFIKKSVHSEGSINIFFTDHSFFESFGASFNSKIDQSTEKMPRPFEAIRSSTSTLSNMTFIKENIKQQHFCLPKPLMYFIRKNANAVVMQKLHCACKYFYINEPFCIVDELHYFDNVNNCVVLDNKSFQITSKNINVMKNIWIKNKLSGYDEKLMKKIVLNNAKKYLIESKISINTFKHLTRSKSITNLEAQYATISGDDGKLISLEELLLQFPNLEKILAVVQSFKILSNCLPLKNTIKYFDIGFLETVDAKLIIDFLKKALAPKAYLDLRIRGDQAYLVVMKEKMKEMLEAWKPQVHKPSIIMSCFT